MESIGNLAKYVMAHTERGECRCGKCADHSGGDAQPNGHTADLVFFKVAATNDPSADELRTLIDAAEDGEFCKCSPLDGAEHGYMELGGWIGDQGLAMQFMGLCSLLGLCRILTPKILGLPDEMALQLAGAGMLAMQAVAVTAPVTA